METIPCNPSQTRTIYNVKHNTKKIIVSNQPSICQKYHYHVIYIGSAVYTVCSYFQSEYIEISW